MKITRINDKKASKGVKVSTVVPSGSRSSFHRKGFIHSFVHSWKDHRILHEYKTWEILFATKPLVTEWNTSETPTKAEDVKIKVEDQ